MEAKAPARNLSHSPLLPVLPVGRRQLLVVSLALLWSAACSRPREITSLERKEAATLASEAQFAMTVRDWSRTEALLAKATALSPDVAELWVNLGSARVRLKNRDGAKSAYRSALAAYEESYKKNPAETEAVLQQVYVHALLGDVKEARALLEKTRKKLPDDREVRIFVEDKQLEAILADPSFKEIAL